MGEGAGVVVLEEYEHAKARGAKIYAEMLGYGLSGDAYHITAPSPDGDGGFRAMKAAMKRRRAGAGRYRLHQRAWHLDHGRHDRTGGGRAADGQCGGGATMSSTKSATGHLLGAAGAIEAIFCILALRDQVAPPTINLDNPDGGDGAGSGAEPGGPAQDRRGAVEQLRLRRHQCLVDPRAGGGLMWRHVAANFLTVAIVLLVVAAGLIAWGQRQYAGTGPLDEAICLQVPRGATLRTVSQDLAARGAVSSAYIFKVGADYAGRAGQIKAGSYLVAPGATMAGIVEAITGSGQSTCGTEVNYRIGVLASDVVLRELDPATNRYVEVVKFDPAQAAAPKEFVDVVDNPDVRFRVTLAEGTTSWQAVEALKRATFLAGELAEVPAEGRLAPDSYEVARGGERAALLAEMQARQDRILADLWAARVEGLPYETPEEALIMASIVEKETGVPEERRRVASVFVNRLRQGIKLQTDPSVIYGLTKGQGALGRGLRQSELRSNTPYNTYVIDGLPPAPIANPGRESIAAALEPEVTDDLFFVADGSGGHAFAETLAEHNANVAKWRAIEAQQTAPAADGN